MMKARFRRLFVLVLYCSLLLAVGSQSLAGQVMPPAPGAGGAELVSDAVGYSPASPNFTGCNPDIAQVVNASYEQQVVEMVNAERAKVSLPPLKRSGDLDKAARYYSTDMGVDDYFNVDHATYDGIGGTIYQCDSWTRIQLYYPSPLAENIAAGSATPQEVVQDVWMKSQGHKDNILSTTSWEIGSGYYGGGGTYTHYWTLDFGQQKGVYPVIIDGEKATTSATSVSLYIYGSGDWDQMCVADGTGACTNWESFQSTKNWTLSAGAGQKTVCVNLRKGTNTAQSCDTITLGPVQPVTDRVYLPSVQRNKAP